MTTACTRSSLSGTASSATPSSAATSRAVGSVMMPTLRAMASAVSGWSPVTIVTRMYASRHTSMASSTPGLGGSTREMRPANTSPLCGYVAASRRYASAGRPAKLAYAKPARAHTC